MVVGEKATPFRSLSLLFLLLFPVSVLPRRGLSPPDDRCDPARQRDPRTLRPDQITVLISGYSTSRIPLLQSIALSYASSPLVSSILVLWGNPSTPAQTLAQLAQNLTTFSSFNPTISISLVRQKSDSLNDRFLPRPTVIGTRAVLICDDDVEVDRESFEFGFKIWRENPNRLIGMFARSHDLDLLSKKWIYTVHPDKYSIVLTKFMILKTEYLRAYSCEGGTPTETMRGIVNRERNCEDILMNFVVADRANAGPVLVGARKVRDWGDARNDFNGGGEVREVGLSSRRGEHRKRRGECIMEFHKVLGRMPLRYSYGKVVDSVGEQGLCIKGGKLVFCDHF